MTMLWRSKFLSGLATAHVFGMKNRVAHNALNMFRKRNSEIRQNFICRPLREELADKQTQDNWQVGRCHHQPSYTPAAVFRKEIAHGLEHKVSLPKKSEDKDAHPEIHQ